jgi:hypothetical protein
MRQRSIARASRRGLGAFASILPRLTGAEIDARACTLRPDDTKDLLSELFGLHWREIRFGVLGGGVEWEIQAAQPPRIVPLNDGTVTLHFGSWHLHLRVGDRPGLERPDPERVQSLIFFRLLDEEQSPTEWGVQLLNGRGEQQMTVLLPSPLRDEDDRPLPRPDWARLALWNRLRRRYGAGAEEVAKG